MEIPLHLSELEPSCGKCHYSKNLKTKPNKDKTKQKERNRTFVKCNTCGVFLSLVASASDQDCSYKHHLQA